MDQNIQLQVREALLFPRVLPPGVSPTTTTARPPVHGPVTVAASHTSAVHATTTNPQAGLTDIATTSADGTSSTSTPAATSAGGALAIVIIVIIIISVLSCVGACIWRCCVSKRRQIPERQTHAHNQPWNQNAYGAQQPPFRHYDYTEGLSREEGYEQNRNNIPLHEMDIASGKDPIRASAWNVPQRPRRTDEEENN